MNRVLKLNLKRTLVGVCGGVMLSAASLPTVAAETYRMSTLAPGTSPYMVMSHFANKVNTKLDDYSIIVNATGVAPKHALDTARGRGEFFMTSPNLHKLMMSGEGMFSTISTAPELADNLRAVFMFPMGLYHSVVFADSGILSIEDLKGKRVFTGPPGSVARHTSEIMIQAATGYEAGKDYTAISLSFDSASQSFQDGSIDVYFNPTVAPSPVVSQFALTNKVRFLGFDKDAFETNETLRNLTQVPGYTVKTLDPGVYGENQVNTEPVYTIAVTIGIATHKDMPEEAIYNITKAYWEDLEKDKAHAPWLRSVSLDGVFEEMNMQMHPGAARYFREIGLEVPVVE